MDLSLEELLSLSYLKYSCFVSFETFIHQQHLYELKKIDSKPKSSVFS